jgi:hypothetical protein
MYVSPKQASRFALYVLLATLFFMVGYFWPTPTDKEYHTNYSHSSNYRQYHAPVGRSYHR